MPEEIEFEIQPFEGFGPVRFDMSHEEVIAVLGDPDWIHPRRLRWRFLKCGLFVDSDEQERCEFIESYHPPCIPLLGGLRLVGTRTALEAALEERGYTLVRGTGANEDVTDIPAVGVSLWTDQEDEEPMESVGAWRRGYREAARTT